LAAAGASAGVRPAVSGPAGAGLLYACLDPLTEPDAAARFVRELRDRLSGGQEGSGGWHAPDPGGSGGASGFVPGPALPRGSVTVLAAPPPVLAAAGAYAAVPGAALMRAIKDQFDPGHRMFPGRMTGGS
ncbi:MAG TPA: hypothetical protein VEH31_18815, partial [Streptosporangiaceae bacterium]|nr:hypothetical protein [Streptosporangiaceae bacterium]